MSNQTLKRTIPLLLIFLVSACYQVRTSDRRIHRKFKAVQPQPQIHYSMFGEREMRYLLSERDTALPTVVFVHGAPGSSKTYFGYLQDSVLMDHARVLVVDRLGYGYSGFGHSETSMQEQAASLASILRSVRSTRKLLVVGHSFGGPIISRLAADYPELVDGLVLLAPAIDPVNEKMFWFTYLGMYPPTSWLTPRSLKVATDEKVSHVGELEKLLPLWKTIKAPVVYFHGDADHIVPYINMEFIQRELTNAPLKVVTLPGEDHDIPYTTQDRIREEIIQNAI